MLEDPLAPALPAALPDAPLADGDALPVPLVPEEPLVADDFLAFLSLSSFLALYFLSDLSVAALELPDESPLADDDEPDDLSVAEEEEPEVLSAPDEDAPELPEEPDMAPEAAGVSGLADDAAEEDGAVLEAPEACATAGLSCFFCASAAVAADMPAKLIIDSTRASETLFMVSPDGMEVAHRTL